ncbi:hypothetical protein [Noviherbaspirillum sp. ST9]|uniref:hypothetical protein n=1 Tax=Noviherbaspirillum sp. ST9 TaxID=3401606 RepID=UPI003B58AE09
MSGNCLMFSWKKSVPGREKIGAAHFNEFIGYLTQLQKNGDVEAFEPILLTPNGEGPLGFFLIRGSGEKLAQLTATPEWQAHVMRATMHLESPRLVQGYCGNAVMNRMELWTSLIPD